MGSKETMNPTIELLKIIGSPFATAIEPLIGEHERRRLHTYAVQNRIPLLYLEILEKEGRIGGLKPIYTHSYARYLKLLDLMVEVSLLLEGAGIEYSIFKTIRPYLAETSDIDILVLDNEEYKEAVEVLRERWGLKGYGPQSMTFYDPDADLGIDLHKEIAVSYIVYLDKEKLRRYTTRKKLPNGGHVTTLTSQADLLAVMAHSTIKEQIFSLADYFTFLYCLAEMNVQEVSDLIRLVKDNANIRAAMPFLAITSMLHEASYGETPKKLTKILIELKVKSIETNNLWKNGMKMPHKYSLLTVIKAVLEKSKEEKMRRSVVSQMWKMLRPSFTRSVIEGVLDHYKRETY